MIEADTLALIAVEELGHSGTIDEAIGRITDSSGHTFTKDALNGYLKRRGLRAPGSYLGQSDTAITDIQVDTSAFEEQEQTDAELREYRLKDKVRDLEAARKRLLGDIQSRDEKIEVLSALRGAPKVSPFTAKEGLGDAARRQGVPCLVLSDWHIEEPVDPAKVNGLNEFNLDIASACIEKIAPAFEWLSTDKRWDFRDAIIWLGGDLYSGYIHEELQESNFLSPVQAVLWLQERLEKMLRQILATTNFKRILVVCNDGNHGRLTKKIRVGTRTENSLEWLLYKSLAARMQDEKRLEWQIADGEYNYVDVFGTTICFTHGDSFSYGGGVGGLLIPVRRGFNEIRKYRKADNLVLGHFHQRLDAGDILVNGSMIGVNPYAMRIHASPEPRQQSFFIVDAVRGKCVTAPVWL